MKKTDENDKTKTRDLLDKATHKPQSRFTKKPVSVLQKREAEALGMKHASMQRAEQEMMTLSFLSDFGAAQEQMLNNSMAQMMHKIGHIKLPFLRMAFMARSRRLLGRQQPRIEDRKAAHRKAKKTRFKARAAILGF